MAEEERPPGWPPEPLSLVGRVTTEAGEPIQGASVGAKPIKLDRPGHMTQIGIRTVGDGTYRERNVITPGVYEVRVWVGRQKCRQVVHVRPHGATRADFVVSGVETFRFRLIDEGGAYLGIITCAHQHDAREGRFVHLPSGQPANVLGRYDADKVAGGDIEASLVVDSAWFAKHLARLGKSRPTH